MPPALSKKFAGLPRWAWLAIIVGGISVGLILRYRNQQAAAGDTGDTTDSSATADAPSAGDYPVDTYSQFGYGDSAALGPDILGSGGYVNYPVTPLQPGITVSVAGGNAPTPCKETERPKRKPKQGYQWACVAGNWRQIPLRRPGSGHTGHHKPPPRHKPNRHHHRRHQHA